MNGSVRQDLLRPGIVQPPNMLALGNSPFMQNPGHLSQPPLVPSSMGMPQNVNTANSPIPMGMLSGGQAPPPNQRFSAMPTNAMQQYQQQQHQQHQQHQQRQMLMRQNAQQINPATGTGSHIPTQLQGMSQGIPFPGMMQQPPGANVVRRVTSQPHINALSGMSPSIPNGMSMGMNAQTSMPAQLRQANQQHLQQQHHQHQLQMLHQQQMQGRLSSDMNMSMNRQGVNPSLQSNMARSASAQPQVMSSLTQPSPIGSVPHPGGMQPHHQNTFPSGQMPSQHPPPQLSSSPRPGSMSQTHTPSMSMSTPPSHTQINRSRLTPDNAGPLNFLNFAGSQFPGNNPTRIPTAPNPSAYPFVPSSTPPMQISDISQPSPSGIGQAQGSTPNRSSFVSTPAQQYEQMNHHGMDPYNSSFGMPPPTSVPPRPPSHNLHQAPTTSQQQQISPQQAPQQPQQPQQSQQQPHHPSLGQSDQMNVHPQRPQSQPQSIPGRPLSQTSSARTPRPLQPPLPPVGMSAMPGGLTATGRLPVPQQQGPPGQHLPIAPRPAPLSMAPGPGPSTMASAAAASGLAVVDASPSTTAPVRPIPPPPSSLVNLGSGQGLIRLLQFSGVLSSESKQKLQLSWWNDLIKDYFTPKAVMKLTLWKDNQRNEAKPFEIGVPILPRFFLVTTQSGVKSMTLSLDGARERTFGQGHSVVECVAAIWTYKYTNGYTVTLRGPLTAHVIITTTNPPGHAQAPQFALKFEDFQFDANFHEKYIALESIMGSRMLETPRMRNAPTPTPPGTSAQVQQQLQQIEDDKKWDEPRVLIERGSIPGEPVNAFGIPQATMRCLELAESVVAMAEIIVYSKETELGPFDALKEFASKIRSTQSISSTLGGPPSLPLNGITPSNTHTSLSNTFQTVPSSSGLVPPVAPVTLYSSAPASVTNPQAPPKNPPPSMNSPQNASTSASNSPAKQAKSIPQQQQAHTPSQGSGPASSPAVSSGTTTNTPAMSNTSLKRKQTSDAASPTIGPDQPTTKRAPRKRGRTGTTGAG
ncbi:LIM-domain binding protein-domain-containing protein [Crassisporium funariophilum]|nr:LIM-domain binding protein-domain-containing protein [Crassisporium funariophilum]